MNLRRLIAVRPPRESYRTVLRLGLPSLVIVTATAATFQSDRLILSHLSTPDELGRYALVAPVWAGVTSVVAVAGQTLWPWYRQKRVSDGLGFGEVKRNMGLFAFIGAGGATVLLVMGALVITLQTSGTVSPPWPVLAAAAGSVLMQALILPLAMLLTAPDEWRVQAWITVGVATISVVVTSLLCPSLEPQEPTLARRCRSCSFSFR